jgi:hypothetical protein
MSDLKEMEGPMRKFIIFAVAVLVVACAYAAKTAMFPSSTAASVLTIATPAAITLSPHEIHLDYKRMNDLPVHDSTNAN